MAALATEPVVHAAAGSVVGVGDGSIVSYKGIPYARPPVGALRWRSPQEVPAWTAPLQADHFGADCMQKPFIYDSAPLRTVPSEDCLYLNVWAPRGRPQAKRPVMVWIHGGGFVNGGSSPAVYDGAAFARSGVILVSLNYRLGRFGSFAFPGLAGKNGEPAIANFGLLDQIAALQWVKRNIAAFGGDPDNVTLFGESAGGMSVHLLIMSPAARGLFTRAIVESGGGRDLLGGMQSLPRAEIIGRDFARRHGVDPAAADVLEKLRALPPEAVVDDLNLGTVMDRADFSGPIVDGTSITSQVGAAYAKGDIAHIPMLVGSNDADGIFGQDSLDAAYAPVGARRAQAEALYDPDGKKDAQRIGVAIWADTMMIEPARFVSRAVTALGQPVYAYRFAYVATSLRTSPAGASHASEIPYVFDTMSAAYGAKASAGDLREARLVHDAWVRFATTGRPLVSGQAWRPYNPTTDHLMLFGPDRATMAGDPYRTRLDFIESLHLSDAGE